MRFCLNLIILIIFFALQCSNLTKAQEDEYNAQELISMSLEELMNIEVNVSSLLSEAIFNTPSSVTIVDRTTIEKYNFSSVAEALQAVPGFEVLQTIIDRNVSTSRGILQNFYANKILILIDNIPTWQPIYGEGYLERISISDVERIEVLKGPASVLYGSNAYTGVVNIILRQYEENSLRGYGKIGFSHNMSAGFLANYKIGKLNLKSSFNNESSEGHSYMVENASGRDFFGIKKYNYSNIEDVKNFNLYSNYFNHTLQLNWFHYSHTFKGSHPSYISGGNRHVLNHGTMLNYKYNQKLSDNLDAIGKITYDYFEREFPLSTDRTNVVHLAGDRLNGELNFNYKLNNLNGEFGLNSGLRRSHGHETRNGVLDELIRSNLKNDEDIFEWSTYLRIRYDFDDLSMLAGGRYTNNEFFGDNFSTRVSLLYSISEMHSVKLIYGEAFRVPTMFELYFDHPTVIGNKNLEPETSKSYEVAYLFGSSKFFIQLLGYYANYENLIQRISVGADKPNEYRNENHFDGYGTEIELKYEDLDVISVFLNYNYLAGDDHAEYNNYKFVPDHTFNFGLSKNFNKFFVSANGKFISSVEGHIKKIDPQFSLNLHMGFEHLIKEIKLRHVLSIKNITDTKMLIPEYIRQTQNINAIESLDLGTSIFYSIFFELD